MVTSSNRPSLKLVGSPTRNIKVLQLKVELQGVRPKVWRRVLVPSSIRLSKLHVVLLRVMGWDGGHLHEFEFAEGRYGVPDPDWPDESLDDESKVTLNKALGYSATFNWTYDFGDNWLHVIKVEKIDDAMPGADYPRLVRAIGACPPEDVGGFPGYADFLDAMADPKHEEHGRMVEWYGGKFDPDEAEIGRILDKFERLAKKWAPKPRKPKAALKRL